MDIDAAASTSQYHAVAVTFSGSEKLLDSDPFAQLLNTFASQLPLRNLLWRPKTLHANDNQSTSSSNSGTGANLDNNGISYPSSGPSGGSIRTIQTLNVNLEPLSDTLLRTKLKPETRHLFQKSLLERPFCHLYFVIGDDSDAYRTHIRNDIRSWLGTIQGSPTLSAATVTARTWQGLDSSTGARQGSESSSRPQTPTRQMSGSHREPSIDDNASGGTPSKEKPLPPSPEYLIIVITPPEGSPLSSISTSSGSSTPAAQGPNVSLPESSERPSAKTGLGRFYSSSSTASSKNNIIDKVRADFNTSRKER